MGETRRLQPFAEAYNNRQARHLSGAPSDGSSTYRRRRLLGRRRGLVLPDDLRQGHRDPGPACTWEANAPTAAEASAAIRQVGPLRMTTKVKTAVQRHAAGMMFWLSRNRLVGSYLALSAANRA